MSDESEERTTFGFVVRGASSVGKTSLIQRFVDGDFSEETISSLAEEIKTKEIDYKGTKLTLNITDLGQTETVKNKTKYAQNIQNTKNIKNIKYLFIYYISFSLQNSQSFLLYFSFIYNLFICLYLYLSFILCVCILLYFILFYFILFTCFYFIFYFYDVLGHIKYSCL